MTELISPLEQRRLKYAKKKVEFGSRQDEVRDVHMYMCVFVRVCVTIYVCTGIFFMYTCTYVNACMYVRNVCMYVCMCVCLCLHFSILCCESVTGGAFSLH